MRTCLTTHIINDMTKRIARAIVVTGTIGGVVYLLETVTKLVF